MKSIDLKKYYPHPLHEGENTVILVTDEVANALERFIREENNDTLRRYRAKAYYSLDCRSLFRRLRQHLCSSRHPAPLCCRLLTGIPKLQRPI